MKSSTVHLHRMYFKLTFRCCVIGLEVGVTFGMISGVSVCGSAILPMYARAIGEMPLTNSTVYCSAGRAGLCLLPVGRL